MTNNITNYKSRVQRKMIRRKNFFNEKKGGVNCYKTAKGGISVTYLAKAKGMIYGVAIGNALGVP
jgi:hypothetical protein